MAIEINGKIYRNLQEQVLENVEDITELKTDMNNVYDKTTIDGVVEGLEEDIAAKASLSDLATVATTGSYDDLTNKPTIPAAQVNADWNAVSGVAQILNKPSIPSSTDFVTITGTQTITGVKKFENTDGSVYIYPSGFINIAKYSTGRGVTVKPDMLECSGNSGSSPTDFKIANYYTGGSSTYTFDRTKSGTVAVTSDIPTVLNLYQHKYKFDYSDSTDGVYFKFEVAFISSRDTVYTTIADIFTYLLAHNNNGDIVGRTYGYGTVLPTDWVFGGEIEADVTMNALQFTVRDDTYQPVTHELYSNTSGLSLIASSCHLIN